MNMKRSLLVAALVLGGASTSAHALCEPGSGQWAVVGADGVKVKGTMTSSAKVTTGQYRIQSSIFVRDGAFVASIGAINGDLGKIGFISATKSLSNNTSVYVTTYDKLGNPADMPFHLHVMC